MASVVNKFLGRDPTGQGSTCRASAVDSKSNQTRWSPADSELWDCAEVQSMSYIVNTWHWTKFYSGSEALNTSMQWSDWTTCVGAHDNNDRALKTLSNIILIVM